MRCSEPGHRALLQSWRPVGRVAELGSLACMSAPTISDAEMVEIQLRKWMTRGDLSNVTLRPTYSHPSIPAGETVVAEIIDRSGQGVFFTGGGFTLPGRGFVRYEDVQTATWISTQPDRLPRKREEFDHIELSFRDGSSATLADVGQAAFPLLRFFEWMIERRKHAG
jgi:hypothetical protein